MAYRWEALTNAERRDQWRLGGGQDIYVPLQMFWEFIRDWDGPKTFAVQAVERAVTTQQRHEETYDFKDLWEMENLREIATFHGLNPDLSKAEVVATLRVAELLNPDKIVSSPIFNDLVQQDLSYEDILVATEDYRLEAGIFMNLRYETLEAGEDIQVQDKLTGQHLYYIQRLPSEERFDIYTGEILVYLDQLVVLLLSYEPHSDLRLLLERPLKDRDLMSLTYLGFAPYLDWMIIDQASKDYYALQTAYLAGGPLRVQDIPENRDLWFRPSVKELWEHGQTSPAYYYHLFAGRTYPGSHRAYTRMDTLLWQSHSESSWPLLSLSPANKSLLRSARLVELVPGLLSILPVTRYALGMSKGLYFTGKNLDYCGTFYYLEPQSDVVLTLSTPARALSATNKTQALFKLYQLSPSLVMDHSSLKSTIKEYIQRLVDDVSLESYLRSAIKTPVSILESVPAPAKGLLKDLQTIYRELEPPSSYKERRPMLELWLVVVWYLLGGLIESLPDIETLTWDDGTYFEELYAFEDPWDQLLCELAATLNYDVVILYSMAGRYRVVAEVLDTRPRTNSIDSLRWLV
jgi:hypothetical protein